MKFNKSAALLIAAAMAVLLQGCGAQSVKMTKESRAEINQMDRIMVVHYQAPWPSFKTPAGVLASDITFGLSEDWSAGHKLAVQQKVVDPSKQVKEKFLKHVSASNLENKKEPLDHKYAPIDKLKEKYKSGVVLQFGSPWYQIWYYPTSWGKYQLWYGANAILVRLDDSKVLWTSNCRADQNNYKTAPSLDELTAENSTVLKKWVEDATATCAKQMADEFLGKA